VHILRQFACGLAAFWIFTVFRTTLNPSLICFGYHPATQADAAYCDNFSQLCKALRKNASAVFQ